MVHLNWQPLCMMPDPQRFASKQARYYSLRLRPGAVLPDAHLENDVVALRLAANKFFGSAGGGEPCMPAWVIRNGLVQ